jgi:hypothetical protein
MANEDALFADFMSEITSVEQACEQTKKFVSTAPDVATDQCAAQSGVDVLGGDDDDANELYMAEASAMSSEQPI